MRLADVRTIEQANQFLEEVFVPFWEQRFAVAPRQRQDAHRRLRLGREHRLEQILSVRVPRSVAQDHTVVWDGQRWGVPREAVRAGLRGAWVQVERRLGGSHWLRFQGSYLPLVACPGAPRPSASPSGLRPPGLAEPPELKPKHKHIPPPDHPWRRTFLLCVDTKSKSLAWGEV
jgi:hypothetical protein